MAESGSVSPLLFLLLLAHGVTTSGTITKSTSQFTLKDISNAETATDAGISLSHETSTTTKFTTQATIKTTSSTVRTTDAKISLSSETRTTKLESHSTLETISNTVTATGSTHTNETSYTTLHRNGTKTTNAGTHATRANYTTLHKNMTETSKAGTHTNGANYTTLHKNMTETNDDTYASKGLSDNPGLVAVLCIFISIVCIALVVTAVRFFQKPNPEFQKLEDVPMNGMNEEVPFARYPPK